jgi:hypothetical protein
MLLGNAVINFYQITTSQKMALFEVLMAMTIKNTISTVIASVTN